MECGGSHHIPFDRRAFQAQQQRIMARLARVVIADYPYHVTHRGNRQADVFFDREDRDAYRKWLSEYGAKSGLDIWAYCLMANHVHLIAVPRRTDSLARGIGRAHFRYARWVNWRQGWSGHLWANRFHSTALDVMHLWAAVKYVELNPVRAGIVARAEDYEWSSARAHVLGEKDELLAEGRPFSATGPAKAHQETTMGAAKRGLAPVVRTPNGWCLSPGLPPPDSPEQPVSNGGQASAEGRLEPVPSLETLALLNAPPLALADWAAWLAEGLDDEVVARLRKNTCTGRPCGTEGFVALLEGGDRHRP